VSERVRAFARFWYDFVVGDDWRIALGVAVALAGVWIVVAKTSVDPWWIAPIAVAVLLPVSLVRAIRPSQDRDVGGRARVSER
jgi:hypothetical protein